MKKWTFAFLLFMAVGSVFSQSSIYSINHSPVKNSLYKIHFTSGDRGFIQGYVKNDSTYGGIFSYNNELKKFNETVFGSGELRKRVNILLFDEMSEFVVQDDVPNVGGHERKGTKSRMTFSVNSGETFDTVHVPYYRLRTIAMTNGRYYCSIRKKHTSINEFTAYSDDTFKTFIPVDENNLPPDAYSKRMYHKGDVWIRGHDNFHTSNINSGKAKLYKSFDNGTTWSEEKQTVGFDPKVLNEDTFYTMSAHAMWWSYDRGKTWDSVLHEPIGIKWLNDVWMATKDTGYLVKNNTDIMKTYDGGLTWELKYQILGNCGANYIYYINSKNLLFHNIRNLGAVTNRDEYCIFKTETGLEDTSEVIDQITLPRLAEEQVSIYPNPTTGILHLDLPSSWTDYHSTLYTAHGQEIELNNTQVNQLDLSHLPSGIYILQLRHGRQIQEHKVQLIR